jgi:hypothetical protein
VTALDGIQTFNKEIRIMSGMSATSGLQLADITQAQIEKADAWIQVTLSKVAGLSEEELKDTLATLTDDAQRMVKAALLLGKGAVRDAKDIQSLAEAARVSLGKAVDSMRGCPVAQQDSKPSLGGSMSGIGS